MLKKIQESIDSSDVSNKDKSLAADDLGKLAEEAAAGSPDKDQIQLFYDRVCQVVGNVKDVVTLGVLLAKVYGAS